MLNFKQPETHRTVTHPETNATFTIRPLSPRKHTELQKKSMKANKKDEVDVITFSGNCAKYVIVDWAGVGDENGPVECTEENKYTFGENLAFLVMPWLIDEASNLDSFIREEKDAAKKG